MEFLNDAEEPDLDSFPEVITIGSRSYNVIVKAKADTNWIMYNVLCFSNKFVFNIKNIF